MPVRRERAHAEVRDLDALVGQVQRLALGGAGRLRQAAAGGDDTFKSNTWVHITDTMGNTLQTVNFHTSCSQPLFVGDQYGSLRITDCVGDEEPVVGDACSDGKPIQLVMRYTGEDCSASSNSQDPDKVACSGDPAFAATVHILATDDMDPSAGGASVWFQGDVNLDGTFTLDVANAGETKFASETFLHIFDVQGGTILQSVEFHTSCSQPLVVGNQFGSALLEDFIPGP